MPIFPKNDFTAILANGQVIQDSLGGIWTPLERLDACSEVPCILMRRPSGEEIPVYYDEDDCIFTQNLQALPELNHPDAQIISAKKEGTA